MPERRSSSRRSGPRGTIVPSNPLTPRVMLTHAPVELRKLCVEATLGLSTLQLVAGPKVDKPRVAGQPRVDLGHPPEHLLGDPAVVGMALRRGAQLAQVIDLAEVRPEIPPQAEGERHDVLGERRAELPLEQAVGRDRRLDSR